MSQTAEKQNDQQDYEPQSKHIRVDNSDPDVEEFLKWCKHMNIKIFENKV